MEFTFQFILNNGGGLVAPEKESLFLYLLQEYGIGAKTATGFGKFQKQFDKTTTDGYISFTPFDKKERKDEELDEELDEVTGEEFESEDSGTEEIVHNSPEPIVHVTEQPDWANPEDITRGSKVTATVLRWRNGSATVRLHVKKFELVKNKNMPKPDTSIVEVVVSNVLGNLAKGKFDVELTK